MNKYILLATVGMWLSTLSLASDTFDKQDAMKRLEDGASKTNIFELPYFQMKATVQIDNGGKPLDGSYRLLWNGPEHWREEIMFPGYMEVQVGGKGMVWVQRSTDFVPLRIYELHAALGFGSVPSGDAGHQSLVQLGLAPSYKVQKIHSRKDHGEKLTCVEGEDELKVSSEVCVNDRTGTLFRNSFYEDKDFQAVGQKLFPRFLSYVDKDKPVVKVQVTEFIISDQFSPEAFMPPVGVSGKPGCMNPTPYRKIKDLAPKYPSDARQQYVQGSVSLDVLIGLDGIPVIRKVVASPSASLEKSAEDAIAGWRYEPAACESKPVPVETVLRINYTLGP